MFNNGPKSADYDWSHTVVGIAHEGYTQEQCESNPNYYWFDLCGRWMASSYDFNGVSYYSDGSTGAARNEGWKLDYLDLNPGDKIIILSTKFLNSLTFPGHSYSIK